MIGGLSYALDVTEGERPGHAVRSCLVGMRLAQELELDSVTRSHLFYALLLKDAGCSANSARMAALFGADDHVAKRTSKRVNWAGKLPAFVWAVRTVAPRGSARARIDRLRAIKDDWEVDRLAEACAATARGFADVVAELPALLAGGGRRGERWLEGTFWRRARLEGNDVGYSSIVAAGANGTSLHWAPVDGDIRPGQLLLADMGVETTSMYTADVTRTMPVSGTWTPVQRRVYDAVREAHLAGIGEVRAGNAFLAAHRAAQWVLADHLHRWGLIDWSADDALHEDLTRPGAGAHRRYTLHSTSHLLGLDVHDCAAIEGAEYLATTLEPGHALTVEPGLYFQVNDRTVPAELRGLAVRIEDDVVVTDGAARVLSDALPTDGDDLVAWMASAQG